MESRHGSSRPVRRRRPTGRVAANRKGLARLESLVGPKTWRVCLGNGLRAARLPAHYVVGQDSKKVPCCTSHSVWMYGCVRSYVLAVAPCSVPCSRRYEVSMLVATTLGYGD